MFDTLSDRFEGIFARLRSKGRLSESDVDEVLREIRAALLEADVNLGVVRSFVSRVRERCVGAQLSASLSPGQQVTKIVNQELTSILGGETLRITFAPRPPTVVLLAGLQGAGKTTTSAKLAKWFRQQGRQPLLVGADLQRPAAVEQLRVLGSGIGVPVFSDNADPVEVARKGVEEAVRRGRDVVVVDTAGRLAIDEALMDEIRHVSAAVSPHYTFLVIDAMVGQDAVATAQAFHHALQLDGVIVTKLDGDARGGAVLSVKEVVGRPIAFASTGEKVDDFDVFHPDRMADRILGMGDVLTLIESAERNFDADVSARTASRLQEGRFTLDDMLAQFQQLKKLGPLKGVLGMLPGLPKELRQADVDESKVARFEAIMRSMTLAERNEPSIINGSRRQRIARGAGVQTTDVNRLLQSFSEMQQMMKAMGITKSSAKGGAKKGKKGKRGGRVTPPVGGLPIPR